MLTDAGLCWTINSDDMVTIYETERNLGMKDYLEKVQSLKYGDRVFNIPGYGKDNLFKLVLYFPDDKK